MHSFRDISRLTRITVIVLCFYMTAKIALGALLFDALVVAGPPVAPALISMIRLATIADMACVLAAFVLVGVWIYRANANAHALGGDLSVSPGWAVGWFFVPIACLFKPYLAMKETWLASHFGGNWGNGEATDLLNWWWGLWILNGMLGYGVLLVNRDDPALGAEVNLAAALIALALSLVLMRIMLQIRDAQKSTRHAEVFA
jgi:hypothetical protein